MAHAPADADEEADDDDDGGDEVEEQYDNSRYTGIDSILRALAPGHIRLVRLSYLVRLAKEGGVLKRRQELPSEAFIGPDELKVIAETPGCERAGTPRLTPVSRPFMPTAHASR